MLALGNVIVTAAVVSAGWYTLQVHFVNIQGTFREQRRRP
jgi:hypothetical protein